MKETAPHITNPALHTQSPLFFQRSAEESGEDRAFFNDIQTKLTVGAKDDPYEKEADAVADRVVQQQTASETREQGGAALQMKALPSQFLIARAPAASDTAGVATIDGEESEQDESYEPPIQRMCRECDEGEKIFRAPDAAAGGDKRQAVIAMARTMLGKIKAKQAVGNERYGAKELWEIFKLAAPGVWSEDIVKNFGPGLPSWCGIFTVWAHKKAGVDIGNWQMGRGVSAFNTLKPTTSPQPGDIGYIDQPYQHHCIVVKVNGASVDSIDGNSGLFSEVIENTRPLSAYSGFFTAFSGSTASVKKKDEVASTTPTVSSSLETTLNASKSMGTPLAPDTRQSMEQSFGVDFSSVKIHTDSNAVNMSKEINAQAFTHGNDIYFNENKFNPDSTSGKHLLAHELTHTVQQSGSVQRNIQRDFEVDIIVVGPTDRYKHKESNYEVACGDVAGPNILVSIIVGPNGDTVDLKWYHFPTGSTVNGDMTQWLKLQIFMGMYLWTPQFKQLSKQLSSKQWMELGDDPLKKMFQLHEEQKITIPDQVIVTYYKGAIYMEAKKALAENEVTIDTLLGNTDKVAFFSQYALELESASAVRDELETKKAELNSLATQYFIKHKVRTDSPIIYTIVEGGWDELEAAVAHYQAEEEKYTKQRDQVQVVLDIWNKSFPLLTRLATEKINPNAIQEKLQEIKDNIVSTKPHLEEALVDKGPLNLMSLGPIRSKVDQSMGPLAKKAIDADENMHTVISIMGAAGMIGGAFAIALVPGGMFLNIAIGWAFTINAIENAVATGEAANTGIHADEGLMSQDQETMAIIMAVLSGVLSFAGTAFAGLRIFNNIKNLNLLTELAPELTSSSRMNIVRIVAKHPDLINTLRTTTEELEAVLSKLNIKLTFEEVQALRLLMASKNGAKLLTPSGESLRTILKNVWANRAAMATENDVYKVYSGVAKTKPFVNSNPQALNQELEAIQAARTSGGTSYLQNAKKPAEQTFRHYWQAGMTEAKLIKLIQENKVPYRIYLNTTSDKTGEVMKMVVNDLVDSQQIKTVLNAKVGGGDLIVKRSDTIVIYVQDALDMEKAMAHIRNYQRLNPQYFEKEVPLMTQKVMEGVSTASEPMGEFTFLSFGESRARVIFDTLKSYQNANPTEEQFINDVLKAFQARGINPEIPAFNLPQPPPAGTPPVQPKLKVGAVDDPYEKEADEMADQVVKNERDDSIISQQTPNIQRKNNSNGSANADDGFEKKLNEETSGTPMDKDTLAEMNEHFEADFSDVLIHTSTGAIVLNNAVNARAFTYGNDIFFNENEYDPHSISGKYLLAHELTHTIQQGASVQNTVQRNVPPSEEQVEEMLSPPKDDRQLIEEAIRNRQPDKVKSIKDLSKATAEEKIQLLDVITHQNWVGPMDEYRIEALWGSFGAGVVQQAQNNIQLWKDGIDKGAELENLLPAQEELEKKDKDAPDGQHEFQQVGTWGNQAPSTLSTGRRVQVVFNTLESANAYARGQGFAAAVFMELEEYVLYKLYYSSWFAFDYGNTRVVHDMTITNVTGMQGVASFVTEDGIVILPNQFSTGKNEYSMEQQDALPAGSDPFAAHQDAQGNSLKGIKDKEPLLKQFEMVMRDVSLVAIENSKKDTERKRDDFMGGKKMPEADSKAASKAGKELQEKNKVIMWERTILVGDETWLDMIAEEKRNKYYASEDERIEKEKEYEAQMAPIRERIAVRTKRLETLNIERDEIILQYPLLSQFSNGEIEDLNEGNDYDKAKAFYEKTLEILKNIEITRRNLNSGSLNLWLLPPIVQTAKAGLNLDEEKTKWVDEKVKSEERWDTAISIALGVVQLGLTIGATLVSGPVGAAMAVGAFGVGAVDAARMTDRYMKDKAASNTALNKNESLVPKDMDGEWAWLVVAWVGVGLSYLDVIKSVRAIKTGASIAEEAAKLSKGSGVAEETIKAASGKTARLKPDPKALSNIVKSALPEDVAKQVGEVPVKVLDDKAFVNKFGSTSGQAVTVVEASKDGTKITTTVFFKESGNPLALREEAVHVAQAVDKEMGPKLAQLSEKNLANYGKMPAAKQLDLYKIKLEVEIDAQKRLIKQFAKDAEFAQDAKKSLFNLESRLREVQDLAKQPGFEKLLAEGKVPWWDTKQLPRLFSKPLTNNTVILDANAGIALRKYLNGEALQDGEKAMIEALEDLGDVEIQISGVAAGEIKNGFIKMQELTLEVERSSKPYTDLMEVLENAKVGQAKGANDRRIIADAFFATRADASVIPKLATHDAGAYNNLYRLSGLSPKLEKMGAILPEYLEKNSKNSFLVTINGKTIEVVPLPRKPKGRI